MARKLLLILWLISILVFNSSAWGEDVSNLLEEGIYAEETKGDLDEAISIYQKIIDENSDNSANIAEAYYRLGICYLKTGNETKAIEKFKELLTDFRDHKEIASDARAQLLKLNALDEEDQTNKPLDLGPVPWEAGETLQYDIKTPAGADAGKMFVSGKEITIDGNDVRRMEMTLSIPIAGTQTYLRTDVLKGSLRPVSSIMRGSAVTRDFDYKAIYEKGHILFTDTAKEKKDIPVEGTVYDTSQSAGIVRRLPLTENYSASYNAFNLQKGKIVNVQLTVTGKETVTVPAGTFECYILEQVSDSITKTKMWVSIDDKKYIVKIETEGNTIELEKVSQVTAEEPVQFNDTKFDISMTAPEGWHFVKSSLLTPTPYKMLLQILSPEVKAALTFVVVNHVGTLPTSQDAAMAVLKQTFKNFTVRPESWVYGDIDGLPLLTYIADYDSGDKKMVEYRFYILAPKELATFILRTDKETFEEIKTDVDSIVQSFKWDKKYNRGGVFERYNNPVNSEFKHYKSNVYNFELDIPVRWYSLPPDYNNSRYEIIRFGSQEGGYHNLIIFRNPGNPYQTLRGVCDQTQEILARGGFGNFVTAETTIGSKDVMTLDFDKTTENGGTWSCRHYFIPDGNYLYILGFGTTDKDGMIDLFDRIAKTFRTK